MAGLMVLFCSLIYGAISLNTMLCSCYIVHILVVYLRDVFDVSTVQQATAAILAATCPGIGKPARATAH
jgi:hypothetical protein